MSLLSIVANKNIIVDKIKELESKKFDSVSNLASYVITECLKAQYSMMRNVLNKNMIAKRHFDHTVKGNELLEKRSLDFWRWSIPLFTSIAALAISIIALIKGQ